MGKRLTKLEKYYLVQHAASMECITTVEADGEELAILDGIVAEDLPEVSDQACIDELPNLVDQLMTVLSPLQREVIVRRFGLHGVREETTPEIAARNRAANCNSVCNAKRHALNKMRSLAEQIGIQAGDY